MKKSIKNKFSAIFISILAGILLICLLANLFFLKGFYLLNKRADIENIYSILNKASVENKLGDDGFYNELKLLCEIDNVSVFVVENDSVLISIDSDKTIIMNQLNDHFDNDYSKLNFHSYSLRIVEDKITDNEYLEMWGFLENYEKFMIRCAIVSVEDNVIISNRFLLYVGIIGMIIGILVILLVTTQITKPILKLTQISTQMARLDFNTKFVPSSDNNEIDVLGENINRMSDTLENTINELKDANSKLKEDIEKKEKQEILRKEFISDVSHELKTPISLIQSYAEGIKEGISDDEESRNYYLDVIIDESNRMNLLVKKLLSLSELESGDQISEYEYFDLNEMIINIIDSMEIIINQKNIKVDLNIGNKPIVVYCDQFKIEEVIRNYLSNAINYSKNDKNIKVFYTFHDSKIRVNVFNTGDLIPSDSIEHIWDKFYKVDKARSRDYGGSGIGLSIVKAVMESIHEEFGVENQTNGVNFYFELSVSGL